jgi:hypothetical protein
LAHSAGVTRQPTGLERSSNMAQKTDSRTASPPPTTISVTDLRTHLAKHLELAHYNGRRFLIERNHEPFAVMLGIEEYRRLVAEGEGK